MPPSSASTVLSTTLARSPAGVAVAGAGARPVTTDAAGAAATVLGLARSCVGLPGSTSATITSPLGAAGTETAMLWLETIVAPLGAAKLSVSSCEPGGSGGATSANWPAASATTVAWGAPFSISVTLAPGAARPAITLSPLGSTRTTSKAGGDKACWLAADGPAGTVSPGLG